METFSLFLNTVYLHATEKKAISISLAMWSQVLIVKYTNPEHSRINTDTEEEDGKKASNLDINIIVCFSASCRKTAKRDKTGLVLKNVHSDHTTIMENMDNTTASIR